jgi:hypothetical protein
MRKLAALLTASLLLAGPASGATTPTATKWNVRAYGFSIILPAKWYAVPRTPAAVQRTIALLKKQKKTGLASEFSFYLTASGKSQLKNFVFQAFYDISPSTDPIAPQVAVDVVKGTYTTADLTVAGNTFARQLASEHKNAKISVPKRIKLPEGPAQFITGTIPVASGLSDGFELYLLAHKGKLYVLKLDVDATVLSQAKVLRSIAENVRWL